MKDTRTTTFGRALTFNYLSIFNGPVRFTGDVISLPIINDNVTINGTLTVNDDLYPIGGIELPAAENETMFDVGIERVIYTLPLSGLPTPGNPTITLNAYAGIIILEDVTLGQIGFGEYCSIDFENAAIADEALIFTTCQQSPHTIAASAVGTINTSLHSIVDGECQIDISNIGQGFANQELHISFFIIGSS
jgi:hypothetical protein